MADLRKDLADKQAAGKDAATIAAAQAAFDKAVEADPVLSELKAAYDKAAFARLWHAFRKIKPCPVKIRTDGSAYDSDDGL